MSPTYTPNDIKKSKCELSTFESADLLKESASPQVLLKLLGIQKEYTFENMFEKIKMWTLNFCMLFWNNAGESVRATAASHPPCSMRASQHPIPNPST